MEQRWDKNCRSIDEKDYESAKEPKEDMSNCTECPWTKSNPHSLKWREYSKKVMGDKPHACHMKSKDVWGRKEGISSLCACVGSINHLKKEKCQIK